VGVTPTTVLVSQALSFPLGCCEEYQDPSITVLPSPSYWSHRESISHWVEREYLREFQGDGLQMNIALDPGSVPRPQRLFGAISLQKSGCTHGLQDVVMIAALHALVHGLL